MIFSLDRQKGEEEVRLHYQLLGLWLDLQETDLQVCTLPLSKTSDVWGACLWTRQTQSVEPQPFPSFTSIYPEEDK